MSSYHAVFMQLLPLTKGCLLLTHSFLVITMNVAMLPNELIHFLLK